MYTLIQEWIQHVDVPVVAMSGICLSVLTFEPMAPAVVHAFWNLSHTPELNLLHNPLKAAVIF